MIYVVRLFQNNFKDSELYWKTIIFEEKCNSFPAIIFPCGIRIIRKLGWTTNTRRVRWSMAHTTINVYYTHRAHAAHVSVRVVTYYI